MIAFAKRPPQPSLADMSAAFQARRVQLRRYVKMVMIACVAIFLLGGARAAASALIGGDASAATPRVREAMTSELGSAPSLLATPVRHLAHSLVAAKTRAPKGKAHKYGR